MTFSRRTAQTTFEETSLEAANLAQRASLLRDAPVRDLDDLIPILARKAREAAIASRRAEDELAEALLAKQERACG